jgi:CHASE2 domain-containing sensor protein
MHLLRKNRKSLLDQVNPIKQWKFYLTLGLLLGATMSIHGLEFVERISLVGLEMTDRSTDLPQALYTQIVKIDIPTLQAQKQSVPLSPELILRAVELLDSYGPAVIVVDLGTESEQYRNSPFPKSTHRTKFVWAREMVDGKLLPVLGRDTGTPPWGVANVFPDPWTNRLWQYRPRFPVEKMADPWPSLAASAVKAFCEQPLELDPAAPEKAAAQKAACAHAAKNLGHSEFLLRHFSGLEDTQVHSLQDLMDGKPGPDSNIYRDKIVVIGGYYGDDVAPTSIDLKMRGARVHAHAIESMLRPPLLTLSGYWEIVIKFLLGFAVALLHKNFYPLFAALLTLVICVGVIFGSLYLYTHVGYWLNAVFVILGVWIEQVYELVEHAQKNSLRLDHPQQ